MPHICNVRVNAICPYWVETDLLASVKSEEANDDPQAKMISNSPRTALSTVVEGFLTLATDEKRNSKLAYII
jgi:NAD(P)-dependent dehydrogenase (short-subunit alcohol dehydrogenase family)